MSSNNSKRKNSDSTNSSTSTSELSKKLLKTESKSGLDHHQPMADSKSSDDIQVLPNVSDRLSTMERELVELKKEFVELKAYNNKTILEDDAYQMKSFWDRNRKDMEDYIAKKIADCTKVVKDSTQHFSKCMRKLDHQITEVWKKEEARTERLDALMEREKKNM